MKHWLFCTAQNYKQDSELYYPIFAKKDPKNRKTHRNTLILHLKF